MLPPPPHLQTPPLPQGWGLRSVSNPSLPPSLPLSHPHPLPPFYPSPSLTPSSLPPSHPLTLPSCSPLLQSYEVAHVPPPSLPLVPHPSPPPSPPPSHPHSLTPSPPPSRLRWHPQGVPSRVSRMQRSSTVSASSTSAREVSYLILQCRGGYLTL